MVERADAELPRPVAARRRSRRRRPTCARKADAPARDLDRPHRRLDHLARRPRGDRSRCSRSWPSSSRSWCLSSPAAACRRRSATALPPVPAERGRLLSLLTDEYDTLGARGLRERLGRGIPPGDGPPAHRVPARPRRRRRSRPSRAPSRTATSPSASPTATCASARLGVVASVLPAAALPAGPRAPSARATAQRRARGLLGDPRRDRSGAWSRSLCSRSRSPRPPRDGAIVAARPPRGRAPSSGRRRAYVDGRRRTAPALLAPQRVAHEPADARAHHRPCPACRCRRCRGADEVRRSPPHRARRRGLPRRARRHALPLRRAQRGAPGRRRDPRPRARDDAELTSLGFLIGEQSLVAGASDGSVERLVPRRSAPTPAPPTGAPWCSPTPSSRRGAPSPRSRRASAASCFATGDAAGDVWLRHSTSEQVLLPPRRGRSEARCAAAALSPRDDGVLAIDAARERRPLARRASRIPETTLRHHLRQGLVRGLSGAELHLAVVLGHRPLRAEVLARPADLRHAEGDGLLAALRDPDRAPGRGLHLGVRAPARAQRREAHHGDDGLAAVGGARLHRRAGARPDGRDLDRLGAARLRGAAARAARRRRISGSSLPQPIALRLEGLAEARARCSSPSRPGCACAWAAAAPAFERALLRRRLATLAQRRGGQRPSRALAPAAAAARASARSGARRARGASASGSPAGCADAPGTRAGARRRRALARAGSPRRRRSRSGGLPRCSAASASTRAAGWSAPTCSATRSSSASRWASR